MNVTIELNNASSEPMLPSHQQFQHWTETVLSSLPAEGNLDEPDSMELSIRVVDEAESASLNVLYRQKNGSTNILSFPCDSIPGTGINLLGDLAICAPLVKQEAVEQHKTEESHWAHLTIHGVLHLMGYDHEESQAAEQMETIEIGIMDTLGYTNPYEQNGKGDE